MLPYIVRKIKYIDECFLDPGSPKTFLMSQLSCYNKKYNYFHTHFMGVGLKINGKYSKYQEAVHLDI